MAKKNMDAEVVPYVQLAHLEYPELTMFQMLERIAGEYPAEPAYEFYGKKTSYSAFLAKIEEAARAFLALGIREGDRVTICMPNMPQALHSFYALNLIGAVANMIHPLSASAEISFYLGHSGSRAIIVPDMFYEKVGQAAARVDRDVTIIVTRVQDELPPVLAAAYTLTEGRKYLKFPNSSHAMTWSKFLSKADKSEELPTRKFDPEKTSVILYSGGTTGTPKGICLSDLNFNACAMQARNAMGLDFRPGLKMLSCMPCFHGFGLGINLHTALIYGVCCILMPSFTNQSYAEMLLKKKPDFIAGVPTIFEALLHIKEFEGEDLSHLKGVYCGGDSLSVSLKHRVDEFLEAHGAHIQVREGYGLTECVTASCLTPLNEYRERSIGLPFADTTYCIVEPGTDRERPRGEEGEIILSGPTVMLCYLDNPEETAETLRTLADGRIWLYTGDMGHMDDDGYIYFHRRRKRLIITKGYNVYPGQLEEAIDSHPLVSYSCVIGVKDPIRIERVKAYVVLKDGVPATDETQSEIMEYLKEKVAAFALPKEMEFRKELPKTLVGKVAYHELEAEAEAQNADAGTPDAVG